MVKLMIVDDEPFIRQGIRMTVPWNENGIEVVGEAANGSEALRLMAHLQPNIVLADIEMPVMGGLELAKQINEFFPDTRVIILSAYGNVQNFTEAIEVKVSRFVLKNADSMDILNNVIEVKEELEKSSAISDSYDRISNIYSENQYLISSTLLQRFLLNQIPAETFKSKVKKLNIDLSGPYYTMLAAEYSSKDSWLVSSSFQKAFAEYHPIAFFINEVILVQIMNTSKEGISLERLEQVLPELAPCILGNQLAIINSIEMVEEFSVSYNILADYLDVCFWHSNKPYALLTQNTAINKQEQYDLFSLESDIVSAVVSKNNEDTEKAIDAYYDFCKTKLVIKTVFLDSIKRLLLLICALLSYKADVNVIVNSIYDFETPEEIIELLKSMLQPAVDSKNPQIAEALKYIDDNYYNDLKLEDVGRQVALSTGYLSRLFKVETGYCFKEWLNRVRIEKSKELIANTNLKYYEIAEKVGYKDYKYFSGYFNKFCGCSAKEYKNNF